MNRGFTLYELMIVIVIIGMLSVIGFMQLDKARKKAEDVRRINSLHSLRDALELHYSDLGTYKVNRAGWYGNGTGFMNFSGYGYFLTNHVYELEKLGYLPKGSVPVYKGYATWAEPDYQDRIYITYCENFSRGYAIFVNLNYPDDTRREELRSFCGGVSAYNSGMDYGFQMAP